MDDAATFGVLQHHIYMDIDPLALVQQSCMLDAI